MVSPSGLLLLAKPTHFNYAIPLVAWRYSFACLNGTGNASFSTTNIHSLQRNAPPARGKNTLKIARKTPIREKGKPPAVGERKNYRKKIVLSNSNALNVNLPDFDSRMTCMLVGKSVAERQQVTKAEPLSKNKENQLMNNNEVRLKQAVSEPKLMASVVGFTNDTIDSLRALEAFKITQSWGLFRKPGILVREESKIMTDRLLQAQEEKTIVRMVIEGARGSGKSMMLLHAMASALVNNWVVIHIPEAQDLTNAVTEYATISGSDLYSQNIFTAKLLDKIAKANPKILTGIKVKQAYPSIAASLEPGCSVYRLCELGAREPELAWPFFLAFWSEVTIEGSPPIMMCLDGLSHILQNSLYLKPDLSYIHSQDLAIVRHFTDYLSGLKKVPNGGAFLAANSRSHSPVSLSLELEIQRSEDRARNRPETQHDPYEKKYDLRSHKILADVEIFRLGGLSKDETRGLLEYWAKSGVLKSKIDEKIVAEKWVLAGHGNAGEILRGSL